MILRNTISTGRTRDTVRGVSTLAQWCTAWNGKTQEVIGREQVDINQVGVVASAPPG